MFLNQYVKLRSSMRVTLLEPTFIQRHADRMIRILEPHLVPEVFRAPWLCLSWAVSSQLTDLSDTATQKSRGRAALHNKYISVSVQYMLPGWRYSCLRSFSIIATTSAGWTQDIWPHRKGQWQFHTWGSFVVSHTVDARRLHHPAFSLSPAEQYMSMFLHPIITSCTKQARHDDSSHFVSQWAITAGLLFSRPSHQRWHTLFLSVIKKIISLFSRPWHFHKHHVGYMMIFSWANLGYTAAKIHRAPYEFSQNNLWIKQFVRHYVSVTYSWNGIKRVGWRQTSMPLKIW